MIRLLKKFVNIVRIKMAKFKEMLCEEVYDGHTIDRESITQLGYSTTDLTWLFLVKCTRCGKTSVIIRQLLDSILYGS